MSSKKSLSIFSLRSYPLFNPDSKDIIGGAEVQLYLIAKQFSKSKLFEQINFFVGDYNQKYIEFDNKIKLVRCINGKNKLFINFLRIIYHFYTTKSDYYLFRAYNIYVVVLILFLKITKKKVIFMVPHDSYTDNNYHKNLLIKRINNLIYHFSNKIIVQNEYQRNALYKRGFSSRIIKSGYKLNEKKINKKDFVLWVGRSEKWKRPDVFLNLAKKNSSLKFIMICQESKDKDYYLKIEKKAHKIKNLEFISFVPFNKIDKYFKNAKIFINTSTQEGFPNTYIQAMKNKTPILALNVNPNNIINQHNLGLCANNSLYKLNKYLNLLYSDNHSYNYYSKNVFNYVEKNHDIKKISLELYEEIVND